MKRNLPTAYRNLYRQAMTGRSRQAAIRVFCLECVSYVREEVRQCTDQGCPLYPYRLAGRRQTRPATDGLLPPR